MSLVGSDAGKYILPVEAPTSAPADGGTSSIPEHVGWMSCEPMVVSALEGKLLRALLWVCFLDESPKLVILVTLAKI